MKPGVLEKFSLDSKVFAITGGAGLLGVKHAEAIAEAGGTPVLMDINADRLNAAVQHIRDNNDVPVLGVPCDITDKQSVQSCLEKILSELNRLDGLVNNAANDPKIGPESDAQKLTRFENITEEFWNHDIAVGLTGAFLCAQVFGQHMASKGGGVILNIASDLAVIAPDQRIYRRDDLPEDAQPKKPVTYSVVKSGLVGLTRYLATYWAKENVRVNAISPGGVYVDQDSEFVRKLTQLIPMGRMANQDEYKASIVYLLSDASSYVTGFNLVADGGRSIW